MNINDGNLRFPLAHRIPDAIRNHFIAMCGEFVGTVLFLFFALSGTQVANSIPSSSGLTVAQTGSNPQQLQYIALCFGFSLAVNAWVFFRISGGLFNPAVTLGMCLIGALDWFRGMLLFFTQILGGVTSAALVSCMFPGALNVSTTLGGNTSIVQGLFIEMFLTAQLVFTIFMLAAEKHKGTYIAPVGIGLSLFIAELTGVYFTGGSLNPARSFGPAVVIKSFHGYHWIYWLGPVLGSMLAAGFYKFIKVLEYETANPGQDTDHSTTVQKRRDLLIAAGIHEDDANQVAHELTAAEKAEKEGGEAPVIANGQQNNTAVNGGMYGTQSFRSKEKLDGPSTVDPARRENVQRPSAVTSGSQAGRYSYLGRSGRQPSTTQRVDSPNVSANGQTQNTMTGPGYEGGSPGYSRTYSSGV
ncbi:hypothetical protein ANO11243_010400 [Dothideomycetidae sp. 11243]|nr:hypothetical protein ANO11243_010400 [fungal sp. No.11243]